MRRSVPLLAALATLFSLLLVGEASAQAGVVAHISLSTQRMQVYVDGQPRYNWAVSTARPGYRTPTGTFKPTALAVWHRSTIYSGSPMPHSIFFTDAGHAIHGSHAIGRLGTPASHGCVRLAPMNAGTLFRLVEAEGLENTRVEVTGLDPIGVGLGGGSGAGRDYGRLTSFDPLAVGIMAGYGTRKRP